MAHPTNIGRVARCLHQFKILNRCSSLPSVLNRQDLQFTTETLSSSTRQLASSPSRSASPSCARKFTSSSSSSSTPPPSKKILNISTLLLQDGLDIRELPLIVRCADGTMFPFTNHITAEEKPRQVTEEDETFKVLLQQCSSVKDIFRLLEIPTDKVTGHSASYALLRMCQLKNANRDWDDLDSFIRTAVMNELYDTVRKEISMLTNETITSLVKCFLRSPQFSQECRVDVHEEIERRIGDVQFSISELCALSEKLQRSSENNEDLIDHIWVHIGTRYQEIDETNIAAVCRILPRTHKYITKMLDKQCQKFWWKLNSKDIATTITSMVRLNAMHGSMFKCFAKWTYLNIHNTSETDLMQIITCFIQFNFFDEIFTRALERYIPARGLKVDTNLLALTLEYIRGRRYLSPRILDTAVSHFTEHGSDYNALQLYTVLRTFGHLNYLPKNSTSFLVKVEDVLDKEFENLDISHCVEILCSFAFLGKIPTNFVSKVLTPSFLTRLKSTSNSNTYYQSCLWLEMFQSAVMLEARGSRIPFIFKFYDSNPHRNLDRVIHKSKLVDALYGLLGEENVKRLTFAKNTVHPIDFEFHVDSNGNVIPYSQMPENLTRIALLIRRPEDYCINSGHLLGEHSMRNRHLKILGYKIIELTYLDICQLRNSKEAVDYLKKELAPYLKLPQE
ncbi:FAST kinase domain-containing protein 3, mitochondrial-like [Gigantopelta aegis]|uniref:FAST kinase domain-containing protein 3, mitochondrial-like n=1 Tax=Gigantopelta aegis TaxID=1735272 RepID=UPI001B8896BF|nr:FAST kinase domain-containing protein 3, mitochondrial-like [Gigantopelta aegis]